ncbi:MAG: ComF family protein [Rubrobacter sp.]|nr:ComF family protein [Rubrobacter sp.]
MSSESYLSALADLFYPQFCVGCERRASDVLCRSCFDNLPHVGSPRCSRCGHPTAFEAFVCDECKDVDFGFESARAPLRYEGVGKEIVRVLKYRGYFPVVEKLMAPLIVSMLDEREFDHVVPVPMHSSRRRRRGFNQAEVVARSVSRKINAPLSDTLEVVRRTRDQVELTAAGRRDNVRGAFQSTSRIRGKILLVDDVFTTGSTMSECAKALTFAGASEVHATSFCRTC